MSNCQKRCQVDKCQKKPTKSLDYGGGSQKIIN